MSKTPKLTFLPSARVLFNDGLQTLLVPFLIEGIDLGTSQSPEFEVALITRDPNIPPDCYFAEAVVVPSDASETEAESGSPEPSRWGVRLVEQSRDADTADPVSFSFVCSVRAAVGDGTVLEGSFSAFYASVGIHLLVDDLAPTCTQAGEGRVDFAASDVQAVEKSDCKLVPLIVGGCALFAAGALLASAVLLSGSGTPSVTPEASQTTKEARVAEESEASTEEEESAPKQRPIHGWLNEDGSWYYYDKSGIQLYGWQLVDGAWYYLGDDGSMRTGWLELDGVWYHLDSKGRLATDWRLIDHHWYYFGPDGAMYEGRREVEGKTYFFMNSDDVEEWPRGSMVSSAWVTWSELGKRSFFYENGTMARNATKSGVVIDADGFADLE